MQWSHKCLLEVPTLPQMPFKSANVPEHVVSEFRWSRKTSLGSSGILAFLPGWGVREAMGHVYAPHPQTFLLYALSAF